MLIAIKLYLTYILWSLQNFPTQGKTNTHISPKEILSSLAMALICVGQVS